MKSSLFIDVTYASMEHKLSEHALHKSVGKGNLLHAYLAEAFRRHKKATRLLSP